MDTKELRNKLWLNAKLVVGLSAFFITDFDCIKYDRHFVLKYKPKFWVMSRRSVFYDTV